MIVGTRSSGYCYICPEIVSLFLKSLPVKSLLQYRCVCKTWKQVIDSRSFVLDHLSLQTKPRVLVQRQRICYLDPSGKYDEFEYILPDAGNGGFYDTIRGPDGEHRFLSHAGCSVHGVVCFFYGDIKEIVLYNPSIRRQLRVPVPVSCLPGGHRRTNSCGFWMDPYTKEFKVVLLSAVRRRIAVYSSRRKEWSESDASALLYKTEFYPCSQVLVERVAYWAASRSSVNFMLYYDFADDRFGSIDFPVECRKKARELDMRSSCVTISKCQGLLSMMYLHTVRWYQEYKVYVMVNGCWSARPSIEHYRCISQIIHVPLWDRGDDDDDDQNSSPLILVSSQSLDGELALFHTQHEGFLPDYIPGTEIERGPFCTPLIPLLPRNPISYGENYKEYSALRYLITTASSEFVETLVTPY